MVDDHSLFCEGLSELINKERDMEVIAHAKNGREAIGLVNNHNPDIVLLDISMPDLNGVETAKILLNNDSDLKIIALTMHAQKQYVRQMFSAGVSGYILKNADYIEVKTAIKDVLKNKLYVSKEIDDLIKQDYIGFVTNNKEDILSNRELEVLQLVAEGNSSKIISDKLCLSIKTVESHRKQIMDKLNLYSIAELTKYAIQQGIISVH